MFVIAASCLLLFDWLLFVVPCLLLLLLLSSVVYCLLLFVLVSVWRMSAASSSCCIWVKHEAYQMCIGCCPLLSVIYCLLLSVLLLVQRMPRVPSSYYCYRVTLVSPQMFIVFLIVSGQLRWVPKHVLFVVCCLLCVIWGIIFGYPVWFCLFVVRMA